LTLTKPSGTPARHPEAVPCRPLLSFEGGTRTPIGTILPIQRSFWPPLAGSVNCGAGQTPSGVPGAKNLPMPRALAEAVIEWWGKAGGQALGRSAFKEAISHLGKAIKMADKTGEGTSAGATASASTNGSNYKSTSARRPRFRRRGIKAACIRARELAAAIDNATERFAIYYGLWLVRSVARRPGARRVAVCAGNCRNISARGRARTIECGHGRALLGHTRLRQGDFIEAQSNLVEALSIYDPERDRKARREREGPPRQHQVAARRGRTGGWSSKKPSRTRSKPVMYRPVYYFKAHFEIVRGDAGAAPRAEIVVKLSQENAMTHYTASRPRDRSNGASTGVGGVRRPRNQKLCAVLRRFTCRGRRSGRRRASLDLDRRSARPRRSDRRTLERRFPVWLPRRDSAQAQCDEYGAGRGCVPHRNRHRAAAGGAQF
jgi:hypothetical protein